MKKPLHSTLLCLITLILALAAGSTVSKAADTTINENQTKVIFFTEPGSTAYSDFISDGDDFIINASSTSGKVSIVIATSDGTVIDIADNALKTSVDGKSAYTTSTHQKLSSGAYKIGVSTQRVTAIRLSIKRMPSVSEGSKLSQNVSTEESITGCSFIPESDGNYIFFQGDTRYGLAMKLFDEEEKCIDSSASIRYMSDYRLYLYSVSHNLKAGHRYYVLSEGVCGSKDCTNELTVVKKIPSDALSYLFGKSTDGKISHYFERSVYKLNIKSKGSYYLSAYSANGTMGLWLYDSELNKVKKAEYTCNATDSYGNRVIKTETTAALSPGEYYVVLRMNDYGKGRFTFKANKVSGVKRIAVTHKPNMKTFIHGMHDEFDLTGTVLTIYYNDGTNTKWSYETGRLIKNAFPIRIDRKYTKSKAKAIISYRGKQAIVECDVKKPDQLYNNAPLLSPATTKKATMDKLGVRFYRYTPDKTGVYSINMVRKGSSSFRAGIYDPKGNCLISKNATYSWKNRNSYYTSNPAAYMKAGNTYYIGMRYLNSSAKGRITLTLHNDTPDIPTSIKIEKTSNTSVEISWKKVKNANGYQIKYYPASDPKKTVKISTTYASENNIDGLKRNTKYIFKIRAYRTLGGKRYYGSWSDNLQK